MRRNPRSLLRQLARELRRRATPGERYVWEVLRNRRFLGLKFRRQAPVEGFIVDFYCRELRLVIEIDGAAHSPAEAAARDADRDQILRNRGLSVYRVQDGPLLRRDLEQLRHTLMPLRTSPSPSLRRGGGG